MRACVAAALVLLLAVPSPAVDPQPAPQREKVKMDDKTKAAVGKALKWMKDQQAGDGSWGNTAITA